jgi:hypothetical protein
MTPRRPHGLAERLAPHLPQRFDPAVYTWSQAPGLRRWRRGGADWPRSLTASGARRRTAQLAQVVERLALLHAAGHDLPSAVDHVVGAGRGPVAAELGGVAAQLSAGTPAGAAFRSWAQRSDCPHVAQLAADLRACADAGGTTAVLDRHARRLSGVAVRDVVHVLRLRTAAVWAAAGIACVTTAAVVV